MLYGLYGFINECCMVYMVLLMSFIWFYIFYMVLLKSFPLRMRNDKMFCICLAVLMSFSVSLGDYCLIP